MICSEKKFSRKKTLNELLTSLQFLNLFHYNPLIWATIQIIGGIEQMYHALKLHVRV